jgi:hypothetical protein
MRFRTEDGYAVIRHARGAHVGYYLGRGEGDQQRESNIMEFQLNGGEELAAP